MRGWVPLLALAVLGLAGCSNNQADADAKAREAGRQTRQAADQANKRTEEAARKAGQEARRLADRANEATTKAAQEARSAAQAAREGWNEGARKKKQPQTADERK